MEDCSGGDGACAVYSRRADVEPVGERVVWGLSLRLSGCQRNRQLRVPAERLINDAVALRQLQTLGQALPAASELTKQSVAKTSTRSMSSSSPTTTDVNVKGSASHYIGLSGDRVRPASPCRTR